VMIFVQVTYLFDNFPLNIGADALKNIT